MSEDRGTPLFRLAPPKAFVRRKVQRKLPPPPVRNRAEHSAKLGQGLEQVRRHFSNALAKVPTLATDVPYVRLQLAANTFLTDSELSSIGLVPVYRRDGSVLAAYSPERDLRKFDAQLASYAQLTKKLAVLAKIETFTAWTREDRTGSRLAEVDLKPDGLYTVDLLLMPVSDETPNPQAVRAIERYVATHRGVVVDRAEQRTFAALRVRLGGQALDDMLEYRDDVALVELPPEAKVVVPATSSLNLDDLPEIGAPDDTAPAVCVVDSGIVEGHPLLEPVVLGHLSRSFPPKLGPPVPSPSAKKAGHGTQVAGVAVYGDVGRCAIDKLFEPQVRLINARILDDENELDKDRMPLLREIVEHAKEECRVFNLSFGLEPHDGFLSLWAAELDALARDYGVLFVASAGNTETTERFGATPPPNYLEVLLADESHVRAPAEALNVLTVGGLTPDTDPYPEDGAKHLGAPKRSPAPFSRRGGIKNVLKPELVELAGSVAYDRVVKRWIDNDAGLRVPTTNPTFAQTGALLGYTSGTSIAAPKVAFMAAQLLQRYPDASPNLVRALLVQSARTPAGVADLPKQQAMKLCGFGVPDLDRAQFCRPQRATLYYEGQIHPDEVHLFEIPVPEEVAKAKGEKCITISLAYDPPVSAVHRDRPAGIQLTWRVAPGRVSPADVQAAIAQEAEREGADDGATDDEPPDMKKIFWKGKLPTRLQQRSTVQKNEFRWTRHQPGDTYHLAITARAIRETHLATEQGYAVVVTLECKDENVNVSQHVRARLGAGRVRIRQPVR